MMQRLENHKTEYLPKQNSVALWKLMKCYFNKRSTKLLTISLHRPHLVAIVVKLQLLVRIVAL